MVTGVDAIPLAPKVKSDEVVVGGGLPAEEMPRTKIKIYFF